MKSLVLTLVAALAVTTAFAQPTTEDFPDFTYTDIEGVEHTLSDYLAEGKIVIIDVFTTWCPNCISSIPGVEAIWDEHGPDGDDTVMILSFERDPNTTDEAQFAIDNGVNNPIITGAEDLIADTWNIPYQPNFFVICPDFSWELKPGGIGSNSSALTDLFENCEEQVSVDEVLENPASVIIQTQDDRVFAELVNANLTPYTVFDLQGKQVAKGILTQGQNEIRTQAKGMLFLQVELNGKAEVIKVVR